MRRRLLIGLAAGAAALHGATGPPQAHESAAALTWRRFGFTVPG